MNELIKSPVEGAELITVASTGKVIVSGTLHHHASSDATLLRYSQAIEAYKKAAFPLPFNSWDLIKYVEYCMKSIPNVKKPYKYATTQIHLSALAFWQRHQLIEFGEPDDFKDPFKDAKFLKSLEGCKNLTWVEPKRKAPLTQSELREIFHTFSSKKKLTMLEIRDRALILSGFFLVLRREQIQKLTHADVTFNDDGSMTVNIAKHKHDKQSHTVIVNGNDKMRKYCVVNALREWIEVSMNDIYNPDLPLFRGFVGRGSKLRANKITTNAIGRIVKARCKKAHLENWDDFGGHSMRRGFATQAIRNGSNMFDVKEAGRWKRIASVEPYVEPDSNTARDDMNASW